MKSKNKIGIVGHGYVGRAMHSFFSKHYEVLVHEQDISLRSQVELHTREEINQCDLALVCVPTPALPNGECDVSIVESVVGWLKTPLILIKSTVAVGTTDRLREQTGKRIVFSPEYCGESSYWIPNRFHTDVKETPFFIFGGDPKDTSRLVEYFLPVAGPVKQYRQTSAEAAEMTKYMENSFFATKITFCYEFATLCESMGIDFNEVRELWLLDPRISPMHTAVFKDNDRPFSGKCLPKDLAAVVKLAIDHGYTPALLEEVLRSNSRLGDLRQKNRETCSTTALASKRRRVR